MKPDLELEVEEGAHLGREGRGDSVSQLQGLRTTLQPPEAKVAWKHSWIRSPGPPQLQLHQRREDKGRPSIEKSRLVRSPPVPWQLGLK